MKIALYLSGLLLILGMGCKKDDPTDGEWLIPSEEVRDGGPGKDGIPAISNPEFAKTTEINFLQDNDLVIGIKHNGTIRAYPHPILDWHEIVNDKIEDLTFAITYCPLTGTGIGWNRRLNGRETTFGVSGLLYNSNLIPYDRATDSNWSQMRLDCVNGELMGKRISMVQIVETSWANWKARYPDTEVMTTETGHDRDYDRYPYGSYRTNSQLIFPIDIQDDRLPLKERVLGIIRNGKAKVYRFSDFAESGNQVIQDEFEGQQIVIVGNRTDNFLLAFGRELADGTLLEFSSANDTEKSEAILVDQEGNYWDIFGEAIEGPRSGEVLPITESYIGYWFSWGAFYPNAEIY